MTRYVKLMAVAFAAGVGVLATAPTAQAQLVYARPAPPGFQPWNYRFMYGGMSFPSPTGGYSFFTGRQVFYRTPLRAWVVHPQADPKYRYSTMYGSVGSLAGPGLQMAAREQMALQQAQRAGRVADPMLRQQVFDQWAAERSGKPLDAARLKDAPEELRQAVLDPSDADVASGKAMNELLRAIQALEAEGVKAETPFLPPDPLARLRFAGGPHADALNLIRTGSTEFPESLRGPEYDAPREAITKDLAAAATQVREGRKVIDPILLDRIAENARRLKKAAAKPADGKRPAGDDAAAAFAARLEAAVKFLKSPEAGGVFVPAWQSAGVTLSDLSKYMAKHKLLFGPAAEGDEPVYAAVHRGMVGYLTQLTHAKR